MKKLSDITDNVVKKTAFNRLDSEVVRLEAKVASRSTLIHGLVKKTDYNPKITEIEEKIPDTSDLVSKCYTYIKVTETENKTDWFKRLISAERSQKLKIK